MSYNTDGLLGVNFTRADADPAFTLGQLVRGSDGTEWAYVQADGAIASAGQVVLLDEGWQAALASTTNTATGFGQRCGVAAGALADNEYGWVQVGGVCDAIQVAASCAANVALNSTATAGQIDDDATAGAEVINGIVLTTARAASAGTAAGVIFDPKVGATLS
jgi:hypothetical protein